MAYADMPKMPVVIATSSIALQKAIITEYIPELSRILLENGVITTPLTAVIRKGREHYCCRHNLLAEIETSRDSAIRRKLERLTVPGAEIDLAEITDLDARTRKHISVPSRCHDNCKHRDGCLYLAFREKAQSYDIDIQVCNQNYLLADTLRRTESGTGLIPNYQALVIDEAHKLVTGAARTMYSSSIASQSAPDILKEVGRIDFKRAGYEKAARRAAKKLSDASGRLFTMLSEHVKTQTDEDGDEHNSVEIDNITARYIRNMSNIAEQLILLLRDESVRVKAAELLSWVRVKYKVDTDGIDVKHILYSNPDEAVTREEQEKRVQLQAVHLHRAICSIPKLKQLSEHEQELRLARRYTYNPEQYVLASEKSAVNDSVWRHVQKLCRMNAAFGEASEKIVKLIWRLQEL
jgi:ATP-dependent DNA helicase DinG